MPAAMPRLSAAPRALLALAALLLAAFLAREAPAQGWERSYTLSYQQCDQQSLLAFGEAQERFPGLISARPIKCGGTFCSYQYVSTLSPNDLLQALYGMIEGQGYRARIGVEGLRYAITCLPGRRAHPLDAAPRGFAEYRTDCGVVIDAAGDVLFDFDRADIRRDAADVLAAIAERIRRMGPAAVEITGHTDSRGSLAYNQALSERRAAAVAAYFAGPLGIRGPALLLRGMGETEPRRPNAYPDGSDNPIGRQANRRVEIFLRSASGGPACRGPGYGGAGGFRPYGGPVPRPYRAAPPTRMPPARPLDPDRW